MGLGRWLVNGLSLAIVAGSLGAFAWYAAPIITPDGNGKPDASEGKPAATPGQAENVLARDVGGKAVENLVDATQPLERLPPRPKLTIAKEPEAKVRRPVSARLFAPVAMSAGVITAEDYVITLKDITPTSPEQTCASDNGSEWPCGARARTALRNYLRGRAIVCTIPGGDAEQARPGKPVEITTECTVVGRDIGQWLATWGWVDVPDNSPLSDLAATARAEARGIHGAGN